jgi:hypothetical protein
MGRLLRQCFRGEYHSSKRCTTTKIDGANRTARQVEAIMPLNTAMLEKLRGDLTKINKSDAALASDPRP